MTSAPVQIISWHDLSIADIDRLEDRLYDHNRRATGSDDGKRLAFVALDTKGTQIGAIAGHSWAGAAEIKQLWVDEVHRGLGIGRGLLEVAIVEASGCRSIWVMSYGFQAPLFYEKCGFHRVAELADWPPGEPDDIANMAVFLASDESRMVTGHVYPVDSGITIS